MKEISTELGARFGPEDLSEETARDAIPTYAVAPGRILDVLRYLKLGVDSPYRMLYDLTAVDQRACREHAAGDFAVVYHLYSFARNQYLRLKVWLRDENDTVASATGLWKNANWYEREVFDMFGLRFDGHPNLRRILMPRTWRGHPLRKDHPARATEMGAFTLPPEREEAEQSAMRFHPEDWGLKPRGEDTEFLFLNLGPQHPGTHGILRVVLQLDEEEVLDAVPEIGFHHRGAEKMGERQTWHTYIPYTDRIDYLAGVLNEVPYLLGVERLAGITVPPRARVIRIMLSELFRIASHLVWYGTFAQDLGALSPVFYMFNDRERIFEIVEAVTGGRMHPGWFRIGGVAQDLPEGWDRLVRDYLAYQPKRMDEYDQLVMRNPIFQARTRGIGAYTAEEAIEWGVTGPNLRACGLEWDVRRKLPYGGYEDFDFEIPTAQGGDCFARAQVRVAEIRQSLRIVQQCLENMPAGPYKSDHRLATPPLKERTMHDIETLIDHFLGVSWGPVIPPGEVLSVTESSKGSCGYYLVSDGDIHAYRLRIRTPSFAHLQMLPEIVRGHMVPDVLAVLGAMDFVLADVDR